MALIPLSETLKLNVTKIVLKKGEKPCRNVFQISSWHPFTLQYSPFEVNLTFALIYNSKSFAILYHHVEKIR